MSKEECAQAGDSSFSSEKHAQLILAQINKMRNGQHFCDVQLQVGKETFQVHRLVLAASSPYFAALFAGGMKESSKDVIQILGIEAGIFELLLDFIYTGLVTIAVNNVQELIVAADMLQLTEVVNLCCDFLKGQIDPQNCIGLFQFSEQIACHDLLEFTENYIHVHFLEVHIALQTLLKEYCEVCKPSKENKFCSFLQTSKVRPRKKARKYLYAVGGYTRLQGGRWSDSRALSCVERFDTFSQYWTTVSSLHQARCEKDSMIFDCTECYDPVTKQWTTVASMNQPRCGLGIGNTIERFDPDENKWEVVGNMAVSRYYFGCCEMQALVSTSSYGNQKSEKWVEVASMKVPRAGMCVVAVNGLLYVSGGRSSSHDFLAPGTLDSVEVYNPHSDTWTEIGNMITSRCEGGVAVL
ncbi:hypothetical protein A6R68_22772 [Neotoma lepida]|uniref:BTB domain-containing protein n=1 Tax=Neotoma lepida TaxID=56216 RepID=A0A1A6HYZ0_NEOLE|nr:hypothetical protein A6R68_22772 [Neotoma lepida]